MDNSEKENQVKQVLSIFDKVKMIKQANPDVSKKIDLLEKEIREKMYEIKNYIKQLNKEDQDLVTVLVIQGIHRTADEVFID
ncbi:MAG: hypothetical protein ACK4NF_05725 [Planctomycetota bacterium]